MLENSPLTLRFSKPMDRASVQAAWSLQPSVPCSFSWADDTTVTCTPGATIASDHDYVLTLAVSAHSADPGALPLASDFTSRFHTLPPPSLTGFSPPAGVQGQTRGDGVVLSLSREMNCDSLKQAFHFASPARAVGAFTSCSISGTSANLQPDTAFAYGDQVSWSLDATATSSTGVALTAGGASNYRVARAANQTLTSVAALDGFAGDKGTVDSTGTALTTGAHPNGETLRGMLTFDLSQLPTSALRIGSATLQVNQTLVRGDPYGHFGSLYATSVPFGAQVSADAANTPPDTRTVCTFLFFCHDEPMDFVLSSSGGAGARSVTVTEKVSLDFTRRGERNSRSQFVTSFNYTLSDGGTALDGTEQSVDMVSGEAATNKPTLQVLYEYP